MYVNSIEHLKIRLRRNGYAIVDQDKQYEKVRPYFILWDWRKDTMVYVDLRVWESPLQYRPQRWYKNWMHRKKIKRVFNKWMRVNKWRYGKHRIDVIEVYPPTPPIRGDGNPVIDHIVDVKM